MRAGSGHHGAPPPLLTGCNVCVSVIVLLDMAKRSYFDGPTSGNPANIKLEGVRPMWLEVSETERWVGLCAGRLACPA